MAPAASTISVVAIVWDTDRQGVAGVPVRFDVVSGGGSVTASTVISDRNGYAVLTDWQLGATPGLNRIRISALQLFPALVDIEGVPVAERLAEATYLMTAFNGYALPAASETGFEVENATIHFAESKFTATYDVRDVYDKRRSTIVTTGSFTQRGALLSLRADGAQTGFPDVVAILGPDGRMELGGVWGDPWPPLSEGSQFRRSR